MFIISFFGMSSKLSAQSSQVQFNNQKNDQNIEISEEKQEILNLLAQMQSSYNFCTHIVNSLFSITNVINSINAQNSFALEQSLHEKNKAFKNSNCFEQLQNNVTQGQFAQENSNASFSLANSAQMQAQAAQSFANAAFSIRQRISDGLQKQFIFSNEEIFTLSSQADNLASSVQSVAESAQNYYYSMQNFAEKIQEKASKIYENINDISNVLEYKNSQ